MARRWWGYGYATEAAQAALAYAFIVLKRDRVISLIRPENRASLRGAERIGERGWWGASSMLGGRCCAMGLKGRSTQRGQRSGTGALRGRFSLVQQAGLRSHSQRAERKMSDAL
ncbi:MAG TPA: GNAT family N-acetyltransferase [Thermoanaerobaculia bacterium]|nr:GNAT family N-acetyltransferase [Thermoanaerobaculia bacterium]